MSIERELLKRFMIELTTEADVISLFNDIKECLALPEQEPEEGVYQKLLRIEDGVEVEILPSELWQDGYEAGKRSVLLSKQPEQEPVAWIATGIGGGTAVGWYEKDIVNLPKGTKLYLHPPKREPLSEEEIQTLWLLRDTNFTQIVRRIEKAHGIGVADEN